MQKNEQVDAYIVRLDPKRLAALEELRALVFEAVPDIEETMQYGMPTYVYNGGAVCAFASQKNYISFYMLNTALVEKHKDGLKGLSHGKSCIRFKGTGDAPLATLRQMLQEATRSPA